MDDSKSCRMGHGWIFAEPHPKPPCEIHTFEHGKPRPSFSEAGDGSCSTTCEVGFGVTRHSNPDGMIGHFLSDLTNKKEPWKPYWEIINPSTAVNWRFFGDILHGFDSRFLVSKE